MVPVCTDTENDGSKSMWFFAKGVYTRLFNGEIKGRITGENLPNPSELWRQRCETAGAPFPSEIITHPTTHMPIRLKPTEAAFKLFEHWQGAQECQT